MKKKLELQKKRRKKSEIFRGEIDKINQKKELRFQAKILNNKDIERVPSSFHGDYWTILENDKNNFYAVREFIKVDFGEIFYLSNVLKKPKLLTYKNRDNLYKEPFYMKIPLLKDIVILLLKSKDVSLDDMDIDPCSNLNSSCTTQLSKMFYFYLLICLIAIIDKTFDWMICLFVTIFFVFPFFLFIYLDGFYKRFGIKIKVDPSNIYCSRINCFNMESAKINKKITSGDYVIVRKINGRITINLENVNSKKTHKIFVDISEQEANYLAKKINNVIAKDAEVCL